MGVKTSGDCSLCELAEAVEGGGGFFAVVGGGWGGWCVLCLDLLVVVDKIFNFNFEGYLFNTCFM